MSAYISILKIIWMPMEVFLNFEKDFFLWCTFQTMNKNWKENYRLNIRTKRIYIHVIAKCVYIHTNKIFSKVTVYTAPYA